MRVAIFAISLFGIAISHVSPAYTEEVGDATAFNAPVPVAANTSGFNVPELLPVARPALRRVPGVNSQVADLAGPTLAPVLQGTLAAPLPVRTMVAPARNAGISAAPPPRSFTDHLLAGVVALMLIAYQLRRKHRVLRPHPFMT